MEPNSKIKFVRARAGYPSDFPPKEFYRSQMSITRDQIAGLRKLIERKSGEKEVDLFIRDNPAVLTAALKFAATGHHGAWVLTQQMIRPKLGITKPGLIPDFIIGGKSSDGFEWWVVELKGVDAQLFSYKGESLQLSDTLNKGICQLLGYIDYCDETQSIIRDQLKLNNFRRPNGLIIIGNEEELESDERKQKLKAAWNKINSSRLEIRTYGALLRIADELHQFANAHPSKRKGKNSKA